jgi:GMP synthase-like glutamine amidotransferase
MRIGILQCGHAPDSVQTKHGDFDVMFKALLHGHDFTYKTWDVVDNEFPLSVDDADGWLITGSKHGAYENHSFISSLSLLIKKIYAKETPMVGVCFGHQIIAQALGGKVEKFSGGWVLGRQEYKLGAGDFVALNAWHQDQVTCRPGDSEIIATNDFCKNAGLVYGRKALTIQPHPEFSNKIMEDYLMARKSSPVYPKNLMETAQSLTKTKTHTSTIANDFAAFFKGDFEAKVIS